MPFEIQVVGLQSVVERLSAQLAVVSNLTPELLLAKDEFGAVEAEKFASGKGFRPNSPGTVAFRAQEGVAGPVMMRSRQLSAALSSPKVFEQSGFTIRTGTDLKQGFFQQMGFAQKWYVNGIAGFYWLAQKSATRQEPNKPIDLDAGDRLRIAQVFVLSLIGRLH